MASVEFQLINSTEFGIIGRIYIPAQCRGQGKVNGRLVYDSDKRFKDHTCNYGGSRTIEFIGTLAEYERCIKAYSLSNMAINKTRTYKLLRELRAAASKPVPVFKPTVIADPWDAVVETATPVAPTEFNNIVASTLLALPPARSKKTRKARTKKLA
jgi:hypothetical protein